MTHNFIIPCGTSHLGERALNSVNPPDKQDYQIFRDAHSGEALKTDYFMRFPPETDKDKPKFNPFLQALIRQVATKEIAQCFVGRNNNPMGGELSTLAKLPEDEWVPSQDTIKLLASETAAGVWCAAMVREVLTYWGVPRDNITLKVVEGLRETPATPNDAIINLAMDSIRAIDPNRQNTIVMTGGFKSGIPVLTIIGLVYAIPLVYIFEEANEIQWIDLRRPGSIPRQSGSLISRIQSFLTLSSIPRSGSGSLSDFVLMIIETWLKERRPPSS